MKALGVRLIGVVLISLALRLVSNAEQTDQAQPFRGKVELVRIPVRVVDHKGRFVKDLAREDFEVLEVAVVFTSGAKGQDLTSDGSLPLSAVDRLRGQFDPSVPIGIIEMTAFAVLHAARDISLDLSASGGAVRKAIVFFSAGIGCAPGAAPSTPGGTLWCGSGMTDTVRAAAGGNVTLYAIDPRGSRNLPGRGPRPSQEEAVRA